MTTRLALSHSDNGSTITDRVFDALCQAIVEGQIPAGSKLSEPVLAARFGVSRGPLREALRRLEAARLVEHRPNFGARVVQLSQRGLLELYDLREALEGMAARQAAARMDALAVADLKALLTTHRHDIANDGWQHYFQQRGDPDFHFRVVQGSGNRWLIDILCHDLYHLARMYRCQLSMQQDRAREALREHELIVEAIADRDDESAEHLMRHHIRAARRGTERRLAAANEQ